MKILFLTRSLNRGGAERQMVVLAAGLQAKGHNVSVVALYRGGPFEADLHQAGVPVHGLEKRGRWDTIGPLTRLFRLFRTVQPDVVYASLTVPNQLSLLARLASPRSSVVWGVQGSAVDLKRYDRFERFTYVSERHLARYADLVVCNSQAGMLNAVSNGFPAERSVVVYNGFDVDSFQPNPAKQDRTLEEWQIPNGNSVVGMVARLHPVKDHRNFIRSAALVAARMPDVRFVCVGDGPEEYRQALQAMVVELGLDGRLQLLPGRPDMDAVYPAFTLLVLSSISEGTPNVIGEAMACGVPVVSTDVGDAALLVGDTGIMVPPARSDLLADACQTMLSEDGAALARRSTAARQRIVEEYSIPKLVLKTEEALERAVAWRHQNRRYSPFASRQTRA